jgi:hypothetical protein
VLITFAGNVFRLQFFWNDRYCGSLAVQVPGDVQPVAVGADRDETAVTEVPERLGVIREAGDLLKGLPTLGRGT